MTPIPWRRAEKQLDKHEVRANLARMETKALETFVAVARVGSFAKVARERGTDPSSVSRTIAELEAELGLRLLQRSTRSMTLTEAGTLYLAKIEPLLEELSRARDDAAGSSGAPRGLLRLSASVTFGQRRIIPLLSRFRARYPDISVECLFTDAVLDLVGEGIDLAVRLTPVVQGDLITSKLMDTRYQVVVSPDYLAKHPALTHPNDLTGHRCLLFNLKDYRTRWLFRDELGAVETVPVDGDLMITPAGALLDAAIAGLGPALLPDWLTFEAVDQGALINVFPNLRATATTFDTAAWLVYPSRSFLPAKVRAMIDFLRTEAV